jgi:thiamine biosynthesis lipoprotein
MNPPAPGRTHSRTALAMDTLVTLRVDTRRQQAEVEAAFDRALHWFAAVEEACSRFDPSSELRHLCDQPGRPVAVSPLLRSAVAFAIEVARATGGAFDPAIGALQQRRGFTRNYRTGQAEPEPAAAGEGSDYRDVLVDATSGTITVRRPLLLDLGAVAKGLALDLAAKELAGFERFAAEAGGDLRCGGMPPLWRIGLRDPSRPEALLGTIQLGDGAVCTSGGYERPAAEAGEHHLLDPRTGRSPRGLASVTVVAPEAMTADALATAAFVLGPEAGLAFLTEQGVDALLVTATGKQLATLRFTQRLHWEPASVD